MDTARTAGHWAGRVAEANAAGAARTLDQARRAAAQLPFGPSGDGRLRLASRNAGALFPKPQQAAKVPENSTRALTREIEEMFDNYGRGVGDELVEISGRSRIVTGAPAVVEHHVFAKHRAKFFRKRGIDVHDYVIDVDDLTHQVLHAGRKALEIPAGWWDQQIMTRIAQREELLRRKLARDEVLAIGQQVQERFGLGHLQRHRYSRAP